MGTQGICCILVTFIKWLCCYIYIIYIYKYKEHVCIFKSVYASQANVHQMSEISNRMLFRRRMRNMFPKSWPDVSIQFNSTSMR